MSSDRREQSTITQTLTSKDFNSVREAIQAFESDPSLIIARPTKHDTSCYTCCTCCCCCCTTASIITKNSMWFTIPEGYYALVTKHGGKHVEYHYTKIISFDGTNTTTTTSTTTKRHYQVATATPVWPTGLHIGHPFHRISHLIPKQNIILNIPVLSTCVTRDNVRIPIMDTSLVFRVMGDEPTKDRPNDDPYNVCRLVYDVTAGGLQDQLRVAQTEIVQNLVRTLTHEEVWDLFGADSVSQKKDEFGRDNVQQRQQQHDTTSTESGRKGGVRVSTSIDQYDITGEDDGDDSPGIGEEEHKDTQDGDDQVDEGESAEESKMEEVGGHVALTVRENDVDDDDDNDEDTVKVGHYHHQDKATTSSYIIKDTICNRLNRQFQPLGIEILNVFIQQITLPEEIQSQMVQRTKTVSQHTRHYTQQKYNLMCKSHEEYTATLKQTLEQHKLELQKEGEYDALRETLKLHHARALGERALSNITTQAIIDVDTIEAESNLTVQKIHDSIMLETGNTQDNARKDAILKRNEMENEIKKLKADTERKCAELEARGDKAMFNAEGVCASKNKSLNEHTTKLAKLQAQEALASNDNVIITGLSGGGTAAANRLILADAALGDTQQKRNGRRIAPESSLEKDREGWLSAVLSEVAIATGRAQIALNMSEERGPVGSVPLMRAASDAEEE